MQIRSQLVGQNIHINGKAEYDFDLKFGFATETDWSCPSTTFRQSVVGDNSLIQVS